MCQMTVFLERNGLREKIMENVTHLETTAEGILVSTLFEAPRLVENSRIKEIDFLDGLAVLLNNEPAIV